jgi:NAD(P)-dependent dehydrogenase (short-subunit alcohol dehydrogenase family)
MDIRGASILVTGGSRGLGAALGGCLAARGARVVLAARHGEPLDAVAQRIRAQGGEAYGLIADIGEKRAIHRLVGAAAALVGPLDVVIHNASVLGPLPLLPLSELDCEALEAVLAANLVGPFRLTKAVLGSMALRQKGLVVHISSDAAVVGYPGWGAYGVSKAALDHLARVWAAETADTGVRFLAIDPGEMDTQMHAEAVPGADRTSLRSPEWVAERITALIASAEERPSGTRLEVTS